MSALPHPNIVDFAALAIVLLGGLNGLRRGLAAEIGGLLSAAASLWLALLAYRRLGDWMAQNTRLSEEVGRALVFMLVAILALILLLILRLLLKQAISLVANNKKVDHLGGLLVGTIKACLAVALVMVGVNLWPHPYLNRLFGEESMVGRALTSHMPQIRDTVEEAQEDILKEE